VRALAHPLRLELLDLLRFEGPATATLMARRVGESSYHLRQLARYGYIEETPCQGGRERWRRYRERPVTVAHGERAFVAPTPTTFSAGALPVRLLAFGFPQLPGAPDDHHR
jgi:hypothetical protein